MRKIIGADMKRLGFFFALAFVGLTILSIGIFVVQASSATWSSSPTSTNWVAGGAENNWSTGVGTFPGATSGTTNSDTATFTGPSSQLTITINNTSLNIKSITFSGSGEPAYTIGSTGGNSLFLTSGGTISISSNVTGANTTNSVNAPLVLEPASGTTAGSYTFQSSSGTASHPLAIGGTVTGATTTAGIVLTLTGANTGANTVSGAISDGNASGGLAITKTSSGNWTLSGPNTYTGNTTISAGTLALSGTGSIVNSPIIEVAGGATFDVSGLTTALTLASCQGLKASSATTTGTIATTTNKGLTTASNSPLQFTAFNGTNAPLAVTGAGSITLASGNVVNVNISNGGVPLGAGDYKLIAKGAGNTTAVNGTVPSVVTVTGDIAGGTARSLVISGGELFLHVVSTT